MAEFDKGSPAKTESTAAGSSPSPARSPDANTGRPASEQETRARLFKGLGRDLLVAIRENDMHKAQGLIMGGVELDARDVYGRTALHLAVSRSAMGVVKLLCKHNVDSACLPKIEAIGGSATGTISPDNDATWCDIFPNVKPDVYKEKVVGIFKRIAKDLAGDVPLKVINDGEVTALAAVKEVKHGNVMGISMGSSEGAGYANEDGNLMGWISELCYCKLDLNPKAPTDPWTKGAHRGLSHLYLGQRGATKLAVKGGVDVPENYKFPHPDMCTIKHEHHAQCLKLIQKAMTVPEKEPQCRKIYETMGVYLGYALGQYSEFYKIDHVMILGRVSKGAGGDIVLGTAKKVLEEEFPSFAKIEFHTATDEFKGVGQCIAAAALPSLK